MIFYFLLKTAFTSPVKGSHAITLQYLESKALELANPDE